MQGLTQKHRLSLLFHLLFALLILAEIGFAITFFYAGYDAVRSQIGKQLQTKIQTIAGVLNTEEARLILQNLTESDAETLRVSQLYGFVPIYPSTYKELDPVKGCRRSFDNGSSSTLDACIGAVTTEANVGRWLYLFARFKTRKLTPHPRGSTDPFASDFVRVEIRGRDGVNKRAYLTFEEQNPKSDSLFKVTVFPADENWKMTARPLTRGTGGTLMLGPDQGGVQPATVLARLPIDYFAPGGSPSSWQPDDMVELPARLAVHSAYPPDQAFGRKFHAATFRKDKQYETDIKGTEILPLIRLLGPIVGEQRVTLKKGNAVVWDSHHPSNQQSRVQPLARADWLGGLLGNLLPSDDIVVFDRVGVGIMSVEITAHHASTQAQTTWTGTIGGWFLILLLGPIAFTFLMYVLIFHAVLRRIVDLSNAAEAAVDVTNPIEFKAARSKDEVGRLAKSFDELFRRVRAHQEINLRSISHEIRGPIQSLLAILPPDHDALKYIGRIRFAVEHLLDLVAPDKAISMMPITLDPTDLTDYLRRIANMVPRTGTPDVTFEGPDRPIIASVDPAALEDTVNHILSNANRHRTPGTTIVIRLQVEKASAVITIKNEGPWIDPDALTEIFEYGVSTQPAGGQNLGQGLAVAKSYVTRMSGEIEAQNVPGGVQLVIKFPIAEAYPETLNEVDIVAAG